MIVRATMTTFSSRVVLGTDRRRLKENRYIPIFKLNLDVSEYLKGEGPTSTVAIWVGCRSFATSDEAERELDILLPERDDRGTRGKRLSSSLAI